MEKEEMLERLEKNVVQGLSHVAAKKDISPMELEMAEKAMCLLEKIDSVRDGSYSEGSYGRMSHNNSYRRGRNMNNGQYMSRDEGGSYRGYDEGYEGTSGHSVRNKMIARLEEMANSGTEYERREAMNLLDKLQTS